MLQTGMIRLPLESDKVLPSPIAFDDATDLIISAARLVGKERISIVDANMRVLAETATAGRTAPSSAVSAMDGFAVRSIDLSSLPAYLKIVATIYPGAGIPDEIGPGECARIFTGAALPGGADRVVVQEIVTIESGKVRIASLPDSRNVRFPGSDFQAGQVIVCSGRRLGPPQLIALAAAQCAEIDVFRRPRVSILCSGDELIAVETVDQSNDRIPESVSVGVAALISQVGGIVVRRVLLPDDPEVIEREAVEALRSSDIVVTVGGASVGDRDYAKLAFARTNLTTLFTSIRMKPAKPTWFGEAAGKPVLGLPGNPTSAFVAARLLLAPLIVAMSGADPWRVLNWRPARYEGAIRRRVDRDMFVCATRVGDTAHPVGSQDSANQRALADADVLLRFRPDHIRDPQPRHLVEAIDI